MPERQSPYDRLRAQMLVVLLCFGLVPLLAMGLAGFVANRDSLESRTRNVLEAMIKNRKVTIDFFLEETARQLSLLAAALPVPELSKPSVLSGLCDQARRDRSAIVDLGLISDRGDHVAYVGPYALAGVNYGKEPWFQQVIVRGRYESDIFLGFRRFPHMVVAVKKREGGRDWILRATIDTDLLSALVREGGLESGADVFILNRVGEYQTRYSDEHRLMERADIGPVPLHSGARIAERTRAGRRELVATAWLKGDSWVLVARQEVPGFSPLLLAHPVVMAVLLLGLVAVPLLSVLIARHRLRQIRGLEAERTALFDSVAQTQKMAAIGRLAAGVAHEINNPLAIIQAQVGLLADELEDAGGSGAAPPGIEELKARYAKIQAQVERGRKVTHRLLGFSRRVGPELEPVNVSAALDETLSFVEKEIEAQETRIVREYGQALPIVRSSLAQMQQVFLNLINNALDAMGKAGELRLTVVEAGAGIEARIADNGPGIAEKDLARLFEPFFSTKSEGKLHSGLGLSICQEIMRNLGGRISVRSKLGEGTTFMLWFPREQDAPGVKEQG
jgi:two-component system, NtrC family, sensor kinase